MLIFFTKEYFPFNHNPTNDNEDVFFVFKVNRERRMAYSCSSSAIFRNCREIL